MFSRQVLHIWRLSVLRISMQSLSPPALHADQKSGEVSDPTKLSGPPCSLSESLAALRSQTDLKRRYLHPPHTIELELHLESSSWRGGNRQLSAVSTCFSALCFGSLTAVNPPHHMKKPATADPKCLVFQPHSCSIHLSISVVFLGI